MFVVIVVSFMFPIVLKEKVSRVYLSDPCPSPFALVRTGDQAGVLSVFKEINQTIF